MEELFRILLQEDNRAYIPVRLQNNLGVEPGDELRILTNNGAVVSVETRKGPFPRITDEEEKEMKERCKEIENQTPEQRAYNRKRLDELLTGE